MLQLTRRLTFLLLTAVAATPAAAQVSRNVTLLAHVDGYTEYAACCSYVHSDGREYAAIGTDTGTAIYNITTPTAPVLRAFIPGPPSIWREMKPYQDYIYIVSEGNGAGAGLQIVSMANPESPVLVNTYTATFTTAHTVTIDHDRALLYANGANGQAGGMRILSLANPASPVQVGSWFGLYVHDSHVRGDTLFAACIYAGQAVALDVSNVAAPAVLGQWSTPGNFTHNSWTSEDGNHLFTTDENATGYLTVYDISDLGNVVEVAQFSANPNAIVHNVRVKGDTAFVSYYTEGVRLLDISDPTTPVEFGYYDTWPGASGGFHGDWDVDPFYPSGVFIVSDIESGLWIFRAEPDYGIVRGVVTESGAGPPLAGVHVEVPETGGDFHTYGEGKWAFALDPGSYTFEFSKFGYFPDMFGLNVTGGADLTEPQELVKIPRGSVTGAVTGAPSTPLADVRLHLHDTPLEALSAAGGAFDFPDVPEASWLLEAERPGWQTGGRTVTVLGNQAANGDLTLQPFVSYYDVEAAAGWTLSSPGDNATAGLWIRADPVGSGPQKGGRLSPLSHHPQYEDGPQSGQPEDDNTPAPGVTCFITGNGPVGGAIGQADVDNGRTTLTSPVFDLSSLPEAVVSFYYWYVNDVGSNPGEDPFQIDISTNGGSTWTNVANILASNHAWERYEFRVADVVAPGPNMRMRFVAMDLGGGSVVEAGVDDFGWFEPTPQSAVPDGGAAARPRGPVLSAGPNPFLLGAEVRLELVAPAARVDVSVFDAAGRLIRTVHDGPAPAAARFAWDGRDAGGAFVPPGVYFVRASGPDFTRTARLVRLR
jgi:choice-of-anchor B domain-containing protein